MAENNQSSDVGTAQPGMTLKTGVCVSKLYTLKEITEYFNKQLDPPEFQLIFLGARCCNRSHADSQKRFLVFQMTQEKFEDVINKNEWQDINLAWELREKNNRQYIVFRETSNPPNSMLFFKNAGGLHDESSWSVDNALFEYKDREWSGGGATVSNVVLAIVNEKSKLYFNWDSYKSRNGSGTRLYTITENFKLFNNGEIDNLPIDFTP